MVNAVIRAQVSGYLLKRPYTEGSFVKKGDLLFELDPSKFRAALDQAQGDLDKAEAQFMKTKQDVERDTPLAKQGAISQKELDDSIQANAAAKGSTAAAKAAVEQAKLNLGWTRVTAPIDGVVGIAKAQIGDLIDANSELTSMSTLDPIKVYFPISEQEYLGAAEKVRERYKERQKGEEYSGVQLELILGGEKVYPHKGQFYLVDRQVDVKTGTIRVAALFPNPSNLLRPGQFARVRAVTKIREKALLVPQRAVTEMQGSYQVAVSNFLAGRTPTPEITAHPLQTTTKYGFGVNVEQPLNDWVGVFGRWGWNEGQHESYAYTEVDETLLFGVGAKGQGWRRKFDRAGLVFVSNGISRDHQEYLALGGIGFLLGDGKLNYAREDILEAYYTAHVWRGIFASIDAQYIDHPGYNRDRGPVFVPGVRLHLEF
jgi:RND family efflux transporter MFP subunit